jgi:hypothetical protein
MLRIPAIVYAENSACQSGCPPLPDILPSAWRAALAKRPFIKIPKSQGEITKSGSQNQPDPIAWIIWPSCLEEFDWPQVGDFEVAIRGVPPSKISLLTN